ncbi:MAG: anti-sigma factor family protein [bacterium]
MKCDLKKTQLLGYFYQDMEADEKQLVEKHLSGCAACQKELKKLSQTSQILQHWPDEESNIKYNFVQEKSSQFESLKSFWARKTTWRGFAIGFAAGIAAVLVVFSLLNFEVNYLDGQFSAKFNLFSKPKQAANISRDPLSQPVTQRQFDLWQQQSLALIQELIQDTEERQRQEVNARLVQFARDLDYQRRRDLQLVGEGLEVFQLTNENRFRHTHETLQELIKVARFERVQTRPEQKD